MSLHHFAKTDLTAKERLDLVQNLVQLGKTTEQIRKELGNVSRQRIHQLIDKLVKDGRITDEERPRTQRRQLLRTNYKKKWGHYPEEASVRELDAYQVQREKFRRKKASNYKHEWDITFDDLFFPTHCPILGIELDYYASERQENSVSFDRLDTTKGYIKGNVMIMSWRANRIKNDGTAEEHQRIADFLRQNQHL
jgi:polyhydroxyalkanoate synthesis regulator phasin